MRIDFEDPARTLGSMPPANSSTAASATAISTTELITAYDGVVALSGVTIEVPVGSSLAVIGPNGSGKSTLLGILAGTIAATGGSFVVNDPAPALVLQSTDVDKSVPITVRDAVSLARYPTLGLFGRFRQPDRDAVNEALGRLQIDDLASRQFHELSGGQRQRVLVAQGLAQDTGVLLLDEPVNGLDVTSQAIILEIIDEEVAAGRSVVVTTHDLDEARRFDQVLLLDTAAIAFGTPDAVLTEDHLRAAFGARFVRIGDEFILDDPHHSH